MFMGVKGFAPPGVDALHADMKGLSIDEGERRNAVMVGGDASLDMAPGRSVAHVTDLLGDFRVSEDEHRGSVTLAGHRIPVTAVIDRNTYEADINFVYAATQYTFHVTRWSRNGMRSFLSLFHGDWWSNQKKCE